MLEGGFNLTGVFVSAETLSVNAVSYKIETGWSSDRSVPSTVAPESVLVTPFCIAIGAGRLFTMPRATVPSWQLKQSFEAPVGWPATALAVVLLYGVYVAVESV